MTKTRILFVCHGNICRSPMAEFILKNMTYGKKVYIESAATSTEELGNDIYPPAKAVLAKHKIPFGKRKARQIAIEDYDRFDYLIGMDAANIRNIKRIFGGDPDNKVFKMMEFAGVDADVADPWYTGEFQTTYEDIEKGCRGLCRIIKENTEWFL